MATQNKLRSARGPIFGQASVGRPARIVSPWEALLVVVAGLARESALRRSRRALLDLDEDQLRDVGLSREDALREGRKSFYLD